MAGATKHHDYHLVESVTVAVRRLGLGFHPGGRRYHLDAQQLRRGAAGLSRRACIGVLYTMVGWWRDVIREAEHGDHTRVVQLHHRYGMILFIASEVMFFVAWFWAYFNVALFPHAPHEFLRTEFIGGVWPPKGIETFDPWHLPLLEHADPADLGHHRHLGASRACWKVIARA